MKLFLIISIIFAVGYGRPSSDKEILTGTTLIKTHTQDEFGNYHFGYNDGQSARQEERTADGIVRGTYTFVDSNNEIQKIEYTADRVNGFQVHGTNLPIAPEPIILDETIIDLPKPVEETPEVAAARAAHLIAVNQAKIRNGEIKIIDKEDSSDEFRGYE